MEETLGKLRELDPVNRVHLKEYIRHQTLRGIKTSSLKTKIWKIYSILQFIKFRDARTLTQADLEDYYIERKKKVTDHTMNGDWREVSLFVRWLLPTRAADMLSTIKIRAPKRKIPINEVLTRDEIQKLVDGCDTLRDRAMIMMYWDSGARLNEVLNLDLANLEIDRFGAVAIVDGKTGKRRIRLTSCVPDLQNWLDTHPLRGQKDAPLFVTYRTRGSGPTRLSFRTVENRLKYLGKKLGMQKRIHAHAFRHARLTDLARQGFSEMELRIIAGWEKSSTMPEIYIHLSGADVEKKILEKAGLIKEEEPQAQAALQPIKCPRCKSINRPLAQYCNACSFALSDEAAAMIEGMLKDVLQHPEMLHR